jgi:hypothetical protein
MKKAGHPPATMPKLSLSEFKHIIRCCYKSKAVSDKIIRDLEEADDAKKFMNTEFSKVTRMDSFKALLRMDDKLFKLIGKYMSPGNYNMSHVI